MFRQISVKQKFHRAHTTFDLEHHPFVLTITGTIHSGLGFVQNTLPDLKSLAVFLLQIPFLVTPHLGSSKSKVANDDKEKKPNGVVDP